MAKSSKRKKGPVFGNCDEKKIKAKEDNGKCLVRNIFSKLKIYILYTFYGLIL